MWGSPRPSTVVLSTNLDRSGSVSRMVVRMILRRPVWLQLIVAVVAAVIVGLAVGVPSALIPNPFFVRMTAVPWWSYTAWVLTAVLSGALAATYVRRSSGIPLAPGRAGFLANIGSLLAVGCPVCNKVVIAAIGVSGALNVWAPIQPLIAAASLAILGWALWRRLKALRACPVGGADVPPKPVAAIPSGPGHDH
jgi:hypothetical protein